MAPDAGAKLGPYEIVELLGTGGMGEVYRARDPRLGRDVAIKVVRREVATDRARVRRLEQEAKATGALNHPNILAVYDVGTQDGTPYVVSELLEGHTLRTRLEDGALPVRKALDYATQLAHGLTAAHSKKFVHRDLKPENIFVTDDGRVKILDFGLAKLTQQESQGNGGATATEAGAVVGTVGYMSPEQVRGEAVDHRSDVFSFGAVLYEMLAGQPAFRRDSAVETMNAILKEDPPPSGGERGIPAGLERIVERCLEKRVEDRFHSAHDLALALEATCSGLSRALRTPEPSAGSASTADAGSRRGRTVASALAVAVLVASGVYWGLVRSRAGPPEPGVIDSIAVLPFENVTGDPDIEYLSDGVAESLINRLARLPDLRVIARTTTFHFRGKNVDPRQVGRELQVGAVVTGRVQVRGGELVIAAELVDVAQGTQLWGERYSERMGDIFGVEEDIAGEITRGLRLTLAPEVRTRLTKRHTEDPEAYRLHLLSRHAFDAGTEEGYYEAVDYARQATERDPRYALAYAALAKSYLWLGGQLSAREAWSRAKEAARKAVDLDATLSEAHTALAQAVLHLDYDWSAAETGLERAVRLNPSSAVAQQAYSIFFRAVGRMKASIASAERARELDPLSPMRHMFLGFTYYFDRQFALADARVEEALRLDPDRGGDAHFLRGLIHRERGQLDEAIALFLGAMEGGVNRVWVLGHLGNAYARAGKREQARECLRELGEQYETHEVGSYEIALVHIGLGDMDRAFEWLDRAHDERDQGLLFLMVDPALDPVRSDPRFQELLARMNLG